jgi:hypothetical protein
MERGPCHVPPWKAERPKGQTGYSQPIPNAGIGGSPRFADIPFDTIFLSIMQNTSLALLSNGSYADISRGSKSPKFGAKP